MSLATIASAGTISVSLVQVDTSEAADLTDLAVPPGEWVAAGYVVYDLVVTVGGDDGDRWTMATAYADLVGATFWEHPMGGDTQPDPDLFADYGLLQYESFWTSSEEFPNADLDPSTNATMLAPGSPLKLTDTERDAEWYVDPTEPSCSGDGSWTIARYAVLPTSPWQLCITGEMYLASTGGMAYPYSVPCIPEAGSLGLLALGGVLLTRRRK
jgi:hypothetical protein